MFKAEFTVLESEAGQRVDALCALKYPHISRSRWTKHAEFLCEEMEKNAKTKVKTGEEWEVSCAEESNVDHLEPWDYPLEILAETDTYLVINKPYGISVHPSSSENSNETMVNALVHHFGANLAENYDEIEGRKVARPGLVHRLDKTTSGVLLIAKTNQAHKFFQDNWKDFEKTYYAKVQGGPPANGKIESGIVRDPYNRKKMKATQDPDKWSVTEFETISIKPGNDVIKSEALLKVNIKTGRTHQIRVHLSSIGFPVIGDELYDGPAAKRIMLHATSLKFIDPDTGKEVLVEKERPF
ncbi:RluA family pseudouridine synthase [bacterium]|nr:RluA family pseudouridine synthase [bacterium]NCQ54899.1 RluA family pseudouridine synthase [Candidatus Parcubacteria bacterium]NCS66943.1 RluA family pseudouridine synthase [Candidatus Peregrinibacteria bacterium]NCS95890.1 RluA family pseudouridine synthase [bacterium]